MDFGANIVKGLLALIFVLALIALVGALARRYGMGLRTPGKGSPTRRLSISEVMPVDSRRRLLLVRRDGVEHLVLLGGGTGGDLLIESNIAVPKGDFAAALAETRQTGGKAAAGTSPP